MIRKVLVSAVMAIPLFSGIHGLTLHKALKILDEKNIEIKVSQYNEAMKAYDERAVDAMNYGQATITIQALRSNDAGNVFGFKLQSREAKFADFGFSQFLAPMGQVLEAMNQNPGKLPPGFTQGMGSILEIEPDDLNYPGARNHFLTKFTYQIPIYTGGKITEYKAITHELFEISQLDTRKLRNEKIFQVKKAFYDITLVQKYIHNLRRIRHNMLKLKRTIKEMKKEGYAKKTDILEIEARLAKVDSMLNQATLNRELAYQFLSFLLDTDVDSIKQVDLRVKMPKISQKDIEKLSIDILKAKKGLEITEHAIEAAKAEFKPMVGAFGEYGSADDHLWDDFGRKDFYTVGLQVQMNIFNGGADMAKLERARVQNMKVATQVELAKKGIALQVKKLQTAIKSLEFDIHSQQKQLKLARAIYKTYEEKYKVGLASITDVLIKQSIELQVLLKYLQVANKHNEKVFELEKILDLGGRE